MRGFRQLIKEQGAARNEAVEHRFGALARRGRVARRRERHPQRRPATIDESDRRRSDRRRPARAAVRAGRRRQPGPRRSSGQALGVEPRRLVAFQASRQDLGFPRSGRRFEAFERRQHGAEARQAPQDASLPSRAAKRTGSAGSRAQRRDRSPTAAVGPCNDGRAQAGGDRTIVRH